MRGLDYYRHTAFEFVTDRLGAQGTVLAGGRYDGLIETLGGPHTPAVGWAAGIERLAMMIDAPAKSAPTWRWFRLASGRGCGRNGLRRRSAARAACAADMAFRGNMKQAARAARTKSAQRYRR